MPHALEVGVPHGAWCLCRGGNTIISIVNIDLRGGRGRNIRDFHPGHELIGCLIVDLDLVGELGRSIPGAKNDVIAIRAGVVLNLLKLGARDLDEDGKINKFGCPTDLVRVDGDLLAKTVGVFTRRSP